jgi:hypothetical protein
LAAQLVTQFGDQLAAQLGVPYMNKLPLNKLQMNQRQKIWCLVGGALWDKIWRLSAETVATSLKSAHWDSVIGEINKPK